MRSILLTLALVASPAFAFTLRDFLPGGNPDSDLDPLARVEICENDLARIWPTPVELGRFEDVTGESDAYVEGWRRAEDPQAFVREHEEWAVRLLSEGYGLRAKLDLKVWNDANSLANVLETRMLQLESINFFLGYVATAPELEALEAKIRGDLVRESHTPHELNEIRMSMEVLTQQAILIDLRSGSGYEVSEELFGLWQAVFRACMKD